MGEWRTTKWGDEISLEYGKAIRGYQDVVAPYRVYGTNGPVGFTDTPLAPGPGVILGRKGAYRGVHYSREPFFVIDTAYYVKPKSPDLTMRWLYYAIIHHKLGEIDDGSPIPSTTRAAVYVRELEVPPIEEQEAIASVLGALDDRIELNRRMNETLERTARAIFKDWFVDFGPTRAKAARRGHPTDPRYNRAPYLAPELWDLFPDALDDEDKPVGWRAGTVGDCFRLTMGQSPPGSTYNDDRKGLPFFQGRTDFGFRYPENRKYCTAPTRIAERDDTLVSVRAPVGDINMAWEKCCAGRGVAALRHASGSRSFTYYSAWAIQQELKQYEHTGTVFGAINKKQFEALSVLEPTPEFVALFENQVAPLDEHIRKNISESRTLTQTRDFLLPKLMSGEIRLREAQEISKEVA